MLSAVGRRLVGRSGACARAVQRLRWAPGTQRLQRRWAGGGAAQWARGRGPRAAAVGGGGGGALALLAACVLEAPPRDGTVAVAFGVACPYQELRAGLEARQERYAEALPLPRPAPALVQWLLAASRLLLASCGAWVAACAWRRITAGGEAPAARADVAELWAGAAAAAAAVVWQAQQWLARALRWDAPEARAAAHAEAGRWMAAAALPQAVRDALPLVAEGLASSVRGMAAGRVQALPMVAVDLLDDCVSIECFVALSHAGVDARRHHRHLRLLNGRHSDALEQEMRRREGRAAGSLSAGLWASAAAAAREVLEQAQLLHGRFLGLENEWDTVHLLLFPSSQAGKERTETLVWVQSASASLVNPHQPQDRLVFTSVQQGEPHPLVLGTLPAAVPDPDSVDAGQQAENTVRQFLLRARYGDRLGM